MNKLTEQFLLKKSRFLKYSLFASISVGAIIAIPFEGIAMSKEAFRIDLSNKLLNNLSQLNGNKDTTNTPQQIGTVIVPEPEINTYTPSEIREMKISNKPKASNPLKDVPVEDHYKVVARSKSDVGKARKVRPITRRKTFVGTGKTEQSQNTYTPESTEQMPQKPEIIITASSPTVSPASNSFVTAPNTPNTTLTLPEHYTTAPGSTSSSTLATPYQPTPDSKPNDSLGANTPPNINTNSKAARRLSFSSSDPQQQAVQSSSQIKPEVPSKLTFVPLPIKKSSTEIAAGMVSNISRVNEMIGIKLAEVTQAIKDTTGKKNKKPLQKLYTQLTSAQKTTEALKSRAEEIETKIKISENKNKIKKLEKELTSKNNEADRLFQKIEKINIPANKVSIKSQETVPVTTASTKVSAFQAQQARIDEARQGIFDKNKSRGDKARKSSAGTEREKKKQEAQKQLSEIKKQEKAIKTAADKAKEVVASVKKETSRTALRAMPDEMNGYSEQLNKIKENLKLLTPVVYNSSTGSTYKQPQKAKPTIPLSHGVQRILGEQPEDAEGYLVPIKVQQQMLPSQEIEDPKSMGSGLGSLSSGTLGKEIDEDVRFYSGWGNMPYTQAANVNSSLEGNLALGMLQQQIQENRSKVFGQLPSHSKDIYETKASQCINYLNSMQPNQSNQAQIDGVIDSLATEMRKLSADQFSQKLGEIAHFASIKAYEGLFAKLYEIQQAKIPETQKVYEQAEIFQSYAEYEENSSKSDTPVLSRSSSAKSVISSNFEEKSALLQTTTTDENLRSDKNWKNSAPYSSSPKFDKRGLDYLDLAGDAFVQNLKQPDTLTIETLGLITPTQNTTVAKSDSSRKIETDTDVDASIYNTAPPEVLKEAEALLDRSQDRLNLVDSTIKKGTQPLSNLSTIYESVSNENLASETIYKTEQPKPSISYENTSKRKLPIPLFRSAELDKKLEYLDLEDKLLKVEEARIVKEKQAIAKLNQDPENLEFKQLAIEARDLSSKESQLKEKRQAIEAAFSLNEEYSSTDVSISRSYSIDDITRSPSVSGLEDLNNSNVMKLGGLKSKHEKIANDCKAKELELDTLNHDDPKFKKLRSEVFEISKEKILLEGEIKHLDTESKPKVTESKPVFSCSSSVGSINSFSNGDDLSSRDVVTPVDTLAIEIDTYIRVLSNKIQKIEELPDSSSRSEELNHIKEAIAYVSNRIQDVEELNEEMLLAINARLQEHDEKISSLLLEKYTGEEAADILAQSLLQEMLVSDGKSESTLPAGDEEQEDTEVSRQLSSLPALASSNECALALSDDREKECLALGDGSEDEESYDSGFEEEEETIGQLSDSDGGNLKITEVDTAIPLEQEAKKEMQTQISENAPTLNQAKVVNTIVNNMIRNRLDASMNMSNNMVAVAAGDEEESHIKRGLWMRGMYGTNNHGRVENMTGYRGTNKGATIGFDAEIDNNIVGIAYSNVHSVFKFKNSKNNDKELINSHVVSIYGQKELPKNFALQALVSASKNFIKDKTTYSYGDTKIRSNIKHRNHSYNAEALLNYNYLLQSKLVITPNIGLRYGKSRDGVYNETGVNVQEIALTMKENNILSGIVGTKVTVPLKDALKFNNLGLTFQGAVEHNFKEKTQRINRVVKIFDNTFKHDYLIPKQPKTSYNLGTGIIGSIKNTTISLDYNYYLNKHYRSHQGSVKLKVNL
ncbi:autotransporter domain-containing protein [Rickettsia sp. 2024-CO-Wats]|uniref:autotransporter domain-containing protein n=1 Tax=unclassified Rickettsia TaxID=114295 RepID=UPI00370DABA3